MRNKHGNTARQSKATCQVRGRALSPCAAKSGAYENVPLRRQCRRSDSQSVSLLPKRCIGPSPPPCLDFGACCSQVPRSPCRRHSASPFRDEMLKAADAEERQCKKRQ